MGQLCSISSGKSDTKDAVGDGPYAFFDRSRTIKRSSRFLYDCDALIVPGEGTEFLPKHFTGKFDLHQRAYALFDFDPQVDIKYIFYFLHYRRDYFPRVAVGATVKSLRRRHFEQLLVSITDLPEQKRIVAILDEAFEGIGAAVANAEKNIANARELFDNYLNSVFAHKGQSWTNKKLEDTVEKTCSLSYGIVQPGEDIDDGLPIVRPTDFRSRNIGLDGLKRITPTLADGYKRTELQGGELLLCVRGGTGAVAVAAGELVGSNVTRGVVPIRFDSRVIIQDFGYFVFISKSIQDQIRAATYGAALMQINIRDLKKVSLALPPLHVQEDLVRILNGISAKVERLASIYEQKVAALAELKQTIVQNAFAGNLNLQSMDAMLEAAE